MLEIITSRLILRPLKITDAESMYEYASDPLIAQFVSWEAHQSVEDSRHFIRECLDHSTSFSYATLAITLKKSSEKVIGTIGLRKRKSHEYELAYALGCTYWRQGIMFEASFALITKAFQDLKIKRIFATCAVKNEASKTLMKKLGMSYEGFFRSASFVKGRYWDVEQYSVLANEWNVRQSLY